MEGGGGGCFMGLTLSSLNCSKICWIFKSRASHLNKTEQISVEMNMLKCTKIIP